MALQAVIDAVQARLAAKFTAAPVVGINTDGEVPSDGSLFVEVQFPVANTVQMDLAARRYREKGTIRLIVNAQRGAGTKAGNEISEQLAALFRSKKFDGVQTWVPSSPVLDDRNDDGLYFPLSFSVPYHYDFCDDAGFYA